MSAPMDRILRTALLLVPLAALLPLPTAAAIGECVSYAGAPCPMVCLDGETVTLRVTGPGWLEFWGCGLNVSIACAGGNHCEHSFGPLRAGVATCRGTPAASCETAW